MDVHPLRQRETGRLQHRGPEEGVEIGDVLADEVMDFSGRCGAIAAPPGIERTAVGGAPLAGGGEVADRCVEPDIPVVPRGIGDLEPEVGGGPRDVPVAQRFTEEVTGQIVGDPRVEGS